MAFWDTLGETISTKGKIVAGKAKDIADVASLKGQIVSYESAINKSFKDVGEAYYESHKDDLVDCELQEMVMAIKEAKAIVSELENRIRELKGTTVCEVCGVVIPEESCFCLKCGAKVTVKTEEFADDESAFVDEDDFEDEDLEVVEVISEDDVEETV